MEMFFRYRDVYLFCKLEEQIQIHIIQNIFLNPLQETVVYAKVRIKTLHKRQHKLTNAKCAGSLILIIRRLY